MKSRHLTAGIAAGACAILILLITSACETIADGVPGALFLQPISFSITNSGNVTAQGVRVVFEIKDPGGTFTVMDASNRARRPRQRSDLFSSMAGIEAAISRDFSIERGGNGWTVEWDVGKVQPKDTVKPSEALFVGSSQSGTFPLSLRIFADNLSHPPESALALNVTTEERSADLDEIEKIDGDRFFASPEGKALWARAGGKDSDEG